MNVGEQLHASADSSQEEKPTTRPCAGMNTLYRRISPSPPANIKIPFRQPAQSL